MGAPIFLLLGLALFVLGLFGTFARRNLLLKLIAINIAASGVFLAMMTAAPPAPDGQPDPLPQAMVLTGIVISVSVTAFALTLIRRLAASARRITLEDDEVPPR